MASYLPSSRAVALWLIHNTALTFQQIADFCEMHILEIEHLAKKETKDIIPMNPVVYGYIDEKEIERCTQDPSASLKRHMTLADTVTIKPTKPARRYTLRMKRQDRPEGIAWIVQTYPQVTDYQICKLLRTTSGTVKAIRAKTHRLSKELKPKDPVLLGLCDRTSLNHVVDSAKKKLENKASVS